MDEFRKGLRRMTSRLGPSSPEARPLPKMGTFQNWEMWRLRSGLTAPAARLKIWGAVPSSVLGEDHSQKGTVRVWERIWLRLIGTKVCVLCLTCRERQEENPRDLPVAGPVANQPSQNAPLRDEQCDAPFSFSDPFSGGRRAEQKLQQKTSCE